MQYPTLGVLYIPITFAFAASQYIKRHLATVNEAVKVEWNFLSD